MAANTLLEAGMILEKQTVLKSLYQNSLGPGGMGGAFTPSGNIGANSEYSYIACW